MCSFYLFVATNSYVELSTFQTPIFESVSVTGISWLWLSLLGPWRQPLFVAKLFSVHTHKAPSLNSIESICGATTPFASMLLVHIVEM